MENEIIEFLKNEFSSVYCDTCESNDSDDGACSCCHRKAMNWSISDYQARYVTKRIMEIISR